MARVLTNSTSFAYCRQESFGVVGASPTWKLTEPNGDITFGAEIKTKARQPISKRRSRRKGSPIGLESSVSFGADLTLDSLGDWAEGFLFSRAVNYDLVWRGANATGTSDLFTVPALTAAQAAKLQWVTSAEATLLWATGYANAGNNGLHVLTVDPVTTNTTLTVAGSTLVTETAPANAELSVCGIRAGTSDLSITVSGGTATLVSAANLDFTTLGLTRGQMIHVGGVTSANQFSAGAGFARIRTIAATTLTLERLDSTLATDAGTGENVDLLFGRFVRDVPVDHADFLEAYFCFEAGFDNLFETTPPTPVADPDGFEYALDNVCDQLDFGFPLEEFMTVKPSFIGSDTEPAVDNGDRRANASTPLLPLHTTACNTASSYARLRVIETDETGLTTDFKDWTLTLKNNVTREVVQGFFGSKYLNTGGFEVDITGTFVFTSPDVTAAIRGNTSVAFDCIVQNDDGGFAIDLFEGILGDGARDYALNESVKLSLSFAAHEHPTIGSSVGISFFPVTPTSFAA